MTTATARALRALEGVSTALSRLEASMAKHGLGRMGKLHLIFDVARAAVERKRCSNAIEAASQRWFDHGEPLQLGPLIDAEDEAEDTLDAAITSLAECGATEDSDA